MTEPETDSKEFFDKNGYMIKRGFISNQQVKIIRDSANKMCLNNVQPAEYEADVHYEGSPASRQAKGGQTVRRYLGVCDRSDKFKQFGESPQLKSCLSDLLGDEILLVRSHHNSLMTKRPKFSSRTNWHRDIRYWHYDHENLISVWLALGYETKDNGALMLIPGTHRIEFERQNFDETLFFRMDLPENKALIDSAVTAELGPGDVLFFHCRTLHAANCNKTDQIKLSLVYTYRPKTTHPVPGTRSSSRQDIRI